MEARSMHRRWPEWDWNYLGHLQCTNRTSATVAMTVLRPGFRHAISSGDPATPRTPPPPLVHPRFFKIAFCAPDTPTTDGIPGSDPDGRVAQSWGTGAVPEGAFLTKVAL